MEINMRTYTHTQNVFITIFAVMKIYRDTHTLSFWLGQTLFICYVRTGCHHPSSVSNPAVGVCVLRGGGTTTLVCVTWWGWVSDGLVGGSMLVGGVLRHSNVLRWVSFYW